ncbi:MAG: glycosyltransferase family 2 protein [Isosphaeraceae bacterium]
MERLEAPGSARGLTDPEPASPSAGPLCSIVIPTYNGRDLLARCLASIERNRPDSSRWPIEVVVADDGSTDGTAEWLAESFPWVRLERLARNGGFCSAANAGIAAARGAFVQLLNNDTEVTPGWLEAGLTPFVDDTVGSVAPLVLVRSEPDRVDSAGDSYAWVGWPMKRGHGQAASRWSSRPVEEVFGASGSSAFYRASALQKTGGLDPLLGSYYEDIDLAFRLRWAGYRCVYNPSCRILHDISATYNHGSSSLQRRMARNAELVFWSNLPGWRLALAAGPHLAFIAAQGLWRLTRGRLGPFLAGKREALSLWSAVLARRKARADLAHLAEAPPHFALSSGTLGDVRNHLRRPRETSSRG